MALLATIPKRSLCVLRIMKIDTEMMEALHLVTRHVLTMRNLPQLHL